MVRKFILLLVLVSAILLSLNLVSAVYSVSFSPVYVNRTVSAQINVSITSPTNASAGNLTLINLTLPQQVSFVADSNSTTLSNKAFANSSTNIWWNPSDSQFESDTTQNFLFNITSQTAGDMDLVLNATRVDGDQNTSTLTVVVNFAFAGFVKNESGTLINGTNVSIYSFTESATGPPTETLIAETTVASAAAGFNFASINGSATNYFIEFIHYNATGSATKTGSIMPPFPKSIYYPRSSDDKMNLNGTTFYLQSASTLRLNATNGTTGILFGYEVIDQKVGFPIKSNMKANVSTIDIIVPSGRDYTVMMIREFGQFTNYAGVCNGSFFNNTACPSPPKSNSTLGTLSAGDVRQVTIDLSITNMRLEGCIKISPRHNETALTNYNITYLMTKLQPWTGFIPPIRGDMGDINLTAQISTNLTLYSQCNSTNYGSTALAFYNISILGNTPYMLEFYAKNASNEAGVGGLYLAGFVNLTTNTTGTQYANVTLYKLLGSYVVDSTAKNSLNTSQMKINIQNASGSAMTTQMHLEVAVKNSDVGMGTVHYMIESDQLTNGTFYLPVLNNSDWVEVAIFPNDAPPIEKKLNLSLSENNISLISVSNFDGGDKGLRRVNESGQLEAINGTALPIQLRFLRRGTTEVITEMNSTEFNPLKALVAGNIDLELKVISTNVTIRFNNFDMFSAKQPPMLAIMDNNTMQSTSQTWQFGNFVPSDVYDNVTITIPYGGNINENWAYNMSIPILYIQDESASTIQLQTAWNYSAGYRTENLTDEFIAYNSSRYRSYLTSGGLACSTTSGSVCYWDQLNNEFEIEIPHFSGISPSISGSAPATDDDDDDDSDNGGNRQTTSYWSKTLSVTDDQFKNGTERVLQVRQRARIRLNNTFHYVGIVGMTATSAKINVSSDPQQVTLYVGDEAKFELTGDNFQDLFIKLNSISASRANLTILSIYENMTVPDTTCIPNWNCTDWSDCVNGTETRTCSDVNDCGTDENKPEESDACGTEAIKEAGRLIVIIVVIVVVIVAVSVLFYFLYKKKKYAQRGY